MECLHIVDEMSQPQCVGKILLWDRFSENDHIDSILDHQEDYSDETREEFLRFVHNFGEYCIDGSPLRDHLRLPDGFSLWWLTQIFERHPAFFGPNLFEIFKLRTLEHLLLGMQPSSVCLHSTNVQLTQTMSALCKSLDIPFEQRGPAPTAEEHELQACGHTLPSCKNSAASANATHTLAAWRRILTRFRRSAMTNRAVNAFQVTRQAWRWWRDVRALFPAAPTVVRQSGLLLGTWFPNVDAKAAKQGRFRSKYWESVHDILPNCGKPVHWFFIHGDPPDKAPENIRLRDALLQNEPGSADMTFLEECVTPWGAVRAWLSAMLVAWQARGLLQHLPATMQWPNSHLNVYPLLAGIWKNSTQGIHLMRMCFALEGIRHYCALIGPQHAVITSSELQFWERLLFREQRNLGCKHIYAAQHSVIRDADFRFFISPATWNIAEFCALMPDKFFCNSDGAYQAMRKSGFPEQSLGMLEATRFISSATSAPTLPDIPYKRILVATSYFTQEALRTLTLLAQAIRLSNHPLMGNILIKPHPYLPVDSMLRQLFAFPPRLVSGAIEDHMTPGTVVLADSATSVGLLACYRSLPLIECASENNFDMSITQGVPGRVSVKNAYELVRALHTIKPTQANSFFCTTPGMPRWHNLLSGPDL